MLPLVTCIDNPSSEISPRNRPVFDDFFSAASDIVSIEDPFLNIVTVPVAFVADVTIEIDLICPTSATTNGELFDGLFAENSSHLPVEPVPSNEAIAPPRLASAPRFAAS
jgi:hypothetical protein